MKKQVHNGVFEISGRKVPGVLTLRGRKSTFELWSDKLFSVPEGDVHGTSSDAKAISVLGCLPTVPQAKQSTSRSGFTAPVTFDLAVVGRDPLSADDEHIVAFRFRFNELRHLARTHALAPFDLINDPDRRIVESLRNHKPEWAPEVNDRVTVIYFGKESDVLPETTTEIGTLSINRGLTGTIGAGISLNDDPTVTIQFRPALNIHLACERMRALRHFLGLVFGHLPTVHATEIATSSVGDLGGKRYHFFDREVHMPSERVLRKREIKKLRGHLPLLDCHGEQRRAEFGKVLEKWFRRNADPDRKRANWRFLDCFLRENYSTDRIIAAANMFDLLPARDWPHPRLKDLKKKVKAKADTVIRSIGSRRLPRLVEVIDHAVDCRNHFVHGKKTKLDYENVKVMVFLTDTLEFVYGISELIECGWDAGILHKLHANDHPFSYYLTMYESHLDASGA